MKIKIWKAILSILPLLFLVVFCIRYVIINRQYPNPTIKKADIGENLDAGGYRFCLEKLEWKDGGYYTKLIPGESYIRNMDGSPYPENKQRIILATISFTKLTDDNTFLDLTSFRFESGAWANSWDPLLFEKLNPEIKGGQLQLQGQEIKKLVFPVVMIYDQFRKKSWKNIEDRVITLVLNNYPEKLILSGVSKRDDFS